MPIYEYRCSDCGNQFELMQKFSDPPAENCPTCSGSVHKLISRSAFHLKGSGWYVTDYGKNGSANGKGTSKNGTEGGESKGSESPSSSESSSSTSSSSSSSGESSSSSSTSSSTTASSAA
ncbi:MAG: FmdB family zinc ribbon protein [Candidatus Tectimicrobiota bacterium]